MILENNHGSCVFVVNYVSACIIVEKLAYVIYVTLCSVSSHQFHFYKLYQSADFV